LIAIHIALNGVRLTLRSREAIFWVFIGPLIMATFFGILFKPQPPAKVRVDIVNADATDAVARSISETLEQDGILVTHAAALTPGHTTLVVPAGAASALAAARPLNLQLHIGAEEPRAVADLRFKVFKALVASAIGVKPTDPPVPWPSCPRTSAPGRSRSRPASSGPSPAT